jgi:hypothetical protein
MRREIHDGQVVLGAGPAYLAVQGDLQLDPKLPANQHAADRLRRRRQPEEDLSRR